jgi:lipopolysaccharide/colanic/teichoic acid biosynthesis glycosyltransferase
MAIRLLDLLLASVALVLASPILAIAALGIRLSSPGPILYYAGRVGRHATLFRMYKFRSMHLQADAMSRISQTNDPRTFYFGAWLRFLKIDELPQLLNIIKGDMAVVGPRAEDPEIVAKYYRPEDFQTLSVPPGLASPGSIFNYTHGEQMLEGENAEQIYARELLPIKLALDRVYLRHASVRYNVRVILRTMWVILSKMAGKKTFRLPPEMESAQRFLESQPVTD